MSDLVKKHWAKLLAFIAGWASEALVDLSAWLQSLLSMVSGG